MHNAARDSSQRSRPAMSNDSLIEVFRAENLPEAHLVKERLEQSGIVARVEGGFLEGALGGVPVGWASQPRVLVLDADAPKARKIIEEFEQT
jgi:hypothetical protein